MEKPKNITLLHYWNASSSEERQEIVEKTFKYLDHVEDKLKSMVSSSDVSETANVKWYVEIVRGSGYISKDGSIKPAIQINEGGVDKLVAPREDLYSR